MWRGYSVGILSKDSMYCVTEMVKVNEMLPLICLEHVAKCYTLHQICQMLCECPISADGKCSPLKKYNLQCVLYWHWFSEFPCLIRLIQLIESAVSSCTTPGLPLGPLSSMLSYQQQQHLLRRGTAPMAQVSQSPHIYSDYAVEYVGEEACFNWVVHL